MHRAHTDQKIRACSSPSAVLPHGANGLVKVAIPEKESHFKPGKVLREAVDASN
jgi:hypothetical protein